VGAYPFRYLGLPMHYRKLNNKDWSFLGERIEKKLCSWKSKMLSIGGRLILLNLVDGLGVQNLYIQNKCLLSKWLFKLCNEDRIWQSLLKNKYLSNKTLSHVSLKPSGSQFWKSLMGVKEQFLTLGKFKLGSGNQVRFWEDKWLGNHKLSLQYPNLFNIVRHKHATVAEVLNATSLNVSCRSSLEGIKPREWNHLVARVSAVNTGEGLDCFVWGLHKSGSFSVKLDGVILTKDNLAKRNWKGSKACEFCSRPETIQHLFFECHYAGGRKNNLTLIAGVVSICWALWLTRNDSVFDKKKPKTYLQGDTLAKVLGPLQHMDDQRNLLVKACQRLESQAMHFFASRG
ncbi:hypothetical protein U9M48_012344, partial [Paspalum notatum var. saurae]